MSVPTEEDDDEEEEDSVADGGIALCKAASELTATFDGLTPFSLSWFLCGAGLDKDDEDDDDDDDDDDDE